VTTRSAERCPTKKCEARPPFEAVEAVELRTHRAMGEFWQTTKVDHAALIQAWKDGA
jgi:hypothetical protein